MFVSGGRIRENERATFAGVVRSRTESWGLETVCSGGACSSEAPMPDFSSMAPRRVWSERSSVVASALYLVDGMVVG